MANVPHISPQEANEKLGEGYTYVDVRTVEEFEEGHPAGAVNVPIALAAPAGMTPNPDFLRVMSAAFPRDAKIVVGCKSAGRSLRAAQALLAEGYTDVFVQRAGWAGARNPFGKLTEPGWSLADLPVEEGTPSGRSWDDMRKKAT
jgi:rhodanese-related sulfurtransferase